MVKVDPSEFPYTIEATDGDLASWRRVFDLTRQGFTSDENYYRLQGKNPDGSRNATYDVMVDIDNLIDYMLIIFYGGNFDAPVSKFVENKWPNNFFAIYDRRGETGFHFFVHDAEHTLLTIPFGPGIGLEENRVNIANLSGGERMTVYDFEKFHPQWLHHRLTAHPDYRARFAEHVQQHFFDGGALTPEANKTRFLQRAVQIETAIIAESARWGDAHADRARTQHDWQRGINHLVDNYFPVRSDIVLEQLQNADLFPTLLRVSFLEEGYPITHSILKVPAGTSITLENPNTYGQILYTLDGSDPRLVDGSPSTTAKTALSTRAIIVHGTSMLQARIRGTKPVPESRPELWSTLRQLILEVEDDLSDVRISEIHYNPLASDDFAGRDLEFIELYNAGIEPVTLSFATFTNGIDYTFPANSELSPGRFLTLAANSQAFTNRYNITAFGEFAGQLNNGGERLTLSTAIGDTILDFKYDDNEDWPNEADGAGFSLVLKEDHTQDFSDGRQWRSSASLHGSPGWADASTAVEGLLSLPGSFALEQNYPNPFNAGTLIRFSLAIQTQVSLKVYDLLGQHVTTILHREMAAGNHRITWRPDHLASGIYLYRLEADSFGSTRKLLLLQ